MKAQTLSREQDRTTARTLSEALPYLQRFTGAVVVVKFGGNAMGDDDAMAEFARDIVLMRQVGVNPVVVHGGGPMINDMLAKLGIKSEFVRGKRVTDKATVRSGRDDPVRPGEQAHRAGDQRSGRARRRASPARMTT